MNHKLIRLAMIAFVSCALITPLHGCGEGSTSSDKPTIDTTTPIKAPDAPSGKKVELAPKK